MQVVFIIIGVFVGLFIIAKLLYKMFAKFWLTAILSIVFNGIAIGVIASSYNGIEWSVASVPIFLGLFFYFGYIMGIPEESDTILEEDLDTKELKWKMVGGIGCTLFLSGLIAFLGGWLLSLLSIYDMAIIPGLFLLLTGIRIIRHLLRR